MSTEHTALVEGRITDEELSVIRPMYAETYPVRPLLNELDALRAEVAGLRATSNQCENECDQLRAEVTALKEQNVEFLEQARGGLEINHDCPAVFACAYILCELTPESEQVDDPALTDRVKGQFTDGRGNDITHLVGEKR